MYIRKLTSIMAMVIILCLSGLGRTQSSHPAEDSHVSHHHRGHQEAAATVTLDELIKTALAQNPSLQAARQTVGAKQARVLAEKTLPDPTLSFQTMGQAIPFKLMQGDPSSGRTVSIQQDIPYPGKLELKGNIANSEAEAEQWNYEQIRRQVMADVKTAYYGLYLVYKSVEVIEKNRQLLRTMSRLAEARYQAAQGNQQDILKVQVEITKLIDKLTLLDQRRSTTEALINSLLYRQPDTPLGRPAEFTKSELHYSLDQLNQLAQSNSPKLKNQDREIHRNEYQVQLAKQEFYPDFSVGLSYVDRDEMREMYGLMVSVKLPVYFWRKQEPQLQSAKLNLDSAQKQRDNLGSTIAYNIKEAYLTATTADKLIQLYTTTAIPMAKLTLESSLASYQTGAGDSLSVTNNVITLLDYELKYHEAVTDFQKALAQMEPIVGVDLTGPATRRSEIKHDHAADK
ncbi:MAG: TolC family protein [Deltaproteobacteria bacterium]|nr:TolC family protein [Deltaproteobacteria bacterium]